MSCGSATKIFTPLVGNDTIRLGFSTPSPQCKCAKKDKTRAEIRNSALSVSALSSQLPALRPQTQSDFYLNMWHVACICALQRALSGVFLHVPGTRGISPGYFSPQWGTGSMFLSGGGQRKWAFAYGELR